MGLTTQILPLAVRPKHRGQGRQTLITLERIKQAKTAYIPVTEPQDPSNQYCYGSLVRLAEGTEFLLFLNAVASGDVYYDPGIKIVNISAARPEIKKRSQFRIRSASIPSLYTKVTEVDVSA